jgi:hypothetical protein
LLLPFKKKIAKYCIFDTIEASKINNGACFLIDEGFVVRSISPEKEYDDFNSLLAVVGAGSEKRVH